ncbi:MAG: site-specific integrase [Clostridia bacterium]|nr:site-specific integrase [Clostridia bacterium]
MLKKLLTNGKVFKRTDGRRCGVVWYMDEQGNRKRKSFSGTTKQEANKKITAYIAEFENQVKNTDESKRLLKDSIQNWLAVSKFPSMEQTTYDRAEATANNQIYPIIGDKVVGYISATDIKNLLNYLMNNGLAYSTVKKAYVLLNEYFKTLYLEELINKNPMDNVEMIKKANFLSSQGKEILPECETVTVFTKEELAKFKKEACSTYSNGKRKYKQAWTYILILNTGMRPGEALALKNCDIDLENKKLNINKTLKEVNKREGTKKTRGRIAKLGKTKTKTSKRTIPLNNTAIEMIKELRNEAYFGEDSPLICDEKGNHTNPVNFRKRFYRILKNAGIETKGLHSLRHTFATNLVNGIKQPDGTIKALTPKQVADLLGHSTSQITELYYVKKDTSRLHGITDGFEM